MAENKTYNAVDFERYHNGSMPANEMHELEKAALEDPFLADALEGYVNSHSVASDVANLRSRLNEKKSKTNVLPVFSLRQNGWWRIAALLAIIAGGSYLFYHVNYRNRNTTNNHFVINRSRDSAQQRNGFSISADTSGKKDIAFENQETSKPEQKKKNVTSSIQRSPEKSQKETAIFSGDANEKSLQSVASPNLLRDEPAVDSFKNDVAKNGSNNKLSKTYLLKGRVTDNEGQAIPFVTVQVENSTLATTSDAKGNFQFQAPDSSVKAVFNAVGYATEKATIEKNDSPTIAMNANQTALNEVVVTGLGVRKMKSKEKKSASKQLSAKAGRIEPGEGESDSTAFDKYLKENLAALYDTNNIRLKGEVSLSFTINKKGRPRNINVVQSSCKACESEAIKLLQDGPSWSKGKNVIRSVLIKF